MRPACCQSGAARCNHIGAQLPSLCAACVPGAAAPAGSDLASCLSRAIQQSYHVVQEQYLAEARELLASHDRLAPPVVVGQPLPLDAGFYQRYKEGRVKVGDIRVFLQLLQASKHLWAAPVHLLALAEQHTISWSRVQGKTPCSDRMHACVRLLAVYFAASWHPQRKPASSASCCLCYMLHCLCGCRLGRCWTRPQAGTCRGPCWPRATTTSAPPCCSRS